MERSEILEELREVFDDVFENHNIIIDEATNANDIEEWNSLTNIELIVSVEEKFNIKVKAADIENLQNVGDLCDLIYAKTTLVKGS